MAKQQTTQQGPPDQGTKAAPPHKLRPGFIAHTEFVSNDPKATQEFLTRVVGWTFKEYPHPQSDDYQAFSTQDETGGGVRGVGQGLYVGSIPYAEVPDLDVAEKAVRAAGGKILSPRMEYGKGMGASLVCQAPGGPVLGLWAPK